MEQVIGSIVIGGLLIFCVLALIIPIVVELGKTSQLSMGGNRPLVLLTILSLASLFVVFWVIR